ncbi:MAG: AgmX/PglI C-terminal domain-containing protein [Deltaproteobacteria bacterium]|nr:AgmX/PglI C-terminal domain-containing protein [Deltaproteobacteria bacterium]
MAGQAPEKILRIGILQSGKILEERVMRKPQSISVGTDQCNTVQIPATFLPTRMPIFEWADGKYTLCFDDACDGFVSIQDNVVDFATLRSQGIAKKNAGRYCVALNGDARGKVVFYDYTLLFQFVPIPEKPPRTKLADLLRYYSQTVDWALVVFWAGSFVIHMSLAAAWQFIELPPEDYRMSELAVRYSKFIADMKKPDEVADKGAGEGEDKAKEKAGDDSKKQKAAKRKELTAEEKAERARIHKAFVKAQVAKSGVLAVLGGHSGSDGAVSEVFSGGSRIGGVEGAFDGAGGGGGYAGAAGDLMSRGSGSGQATGIGAMATDGVGSVGVGSKSQTVVKGQIKASVVEDVDGNLDPKQITAAIKSRLSGIKQCYEQALKRNPKLAGKIIATFVIDENGRVTETRIDSDSLGDSSVASCIIGIIKRVRFPKPDSGTVQASFPFVFTPAG